jgi:FkbM family methyltransferase
MINPAKVLTTPEYLFRPSQILVRLRRLFQQTPTGRATVRLPWGVNINVHPTEVIGARLWYYGIFDLEVAELIFRLLDPGETGLDIGANIGVMTSLMCARAGPKGTVWAFEPHPQNLLELKANVALAQRHDTATPVVHQLALSDQTGTALMDAGSDWAGNRGLSKIVTDNPATAHFTVQAATLDSLFSSTDRCHVCKIDVEGHELQVFKGSRSILSRKQIRDIIFEDLGEYPTDVQKLLRDNGHTLFSIHRRLFGPDLLPLNRQPTFKLGDEGQNYLATLDPDRAIRRCAAKGWKVLHC